MPALFGGSVGALLGRLQAAGANPYSADRTLVVVDESDYALGALVGGFVASLRADGLRTVVLILRSYRAMSLAVFPRLVRAGKALRDLLPDDYYLSNLAVAPERRRRGAGAVLLAACEETAARGKARRVVLDVDEKNEGAIAFYDLSGYRFVSRVAIDLGRRSFRFIRVAKDLGRA